MKKKTLTQNKKHCPLQKILLRSQIGLSLWFFGGYLPQRRYFCTRKRHEKRRKNVCNKSAKNRQKYAILLILMMLFCVTFCIYFLYFCMLFGVFLTEQIMIFGYFWRVFLMIFGTSGQLFWHAFVACFRAPADL